MHSTKLIRLLEAAQGVESGRKGQCTPDHCETRDGRTGAACCKIGFVCPLLNNTCCRLYSFRPPNCRVFPRTRKDLQLVKNCGFHW